MRALVIGHDHVSEPGFVGERLAARGYGITALTVVPEERHHAPDVPFDFPSAGDWDLVVSLGAPWSVYDRGRTGSWIDGEIALLRDAHRAGIPVLGICFGAQALTVALGGTVEPSGHPEIGWYEVTPTGPRTIERGPWLQWHDDRCLIPPGVTELARTAVCTQAFRTGRSLGVQFHPEAGAAVLDRWLRLGGADRCAGLDIDAAELLASTRRAEPAARLRAHRLVDHFLDDIAVSPRPSAAGAPEAVTG